MGHFSRFIDSIIARVFLSCESRAWKQKLTAHERSLRNAARIAANVTFGKHASIVNNQSEIDAIEVGSSCCICGQLLTFPSGGRVIIGSHSFIGENTRIWSADLVSIGPYTLISHNVNIHDNNGHSLDASDRERELNVILPHLPAIAFSHDIRARPIRIGSHVWIGFNSTIRPGVMIGDRAIIACNTLVTQDVPPDTIALGNPQKIIPNPVTANRE